MKGRVLTFDPLYNIPRWLESICLSLKSHKMTHNSCEVFGPLRDSESQYDKESSQLQLRKLQNRSSVHQVIFGVKA